MLEARSRGGARGRVEDVEIVEVRSVRPAAEGASTIEAVWVLGGSVSHYGHTHYRRNRNHGRVTITPEAGVWKIRDLEVLEEARRREEEEEKARAASSGKKKSKKKKKKKSKK